MIDLSLEKISLVKGEEGKIIISYDDIKLYTNIDVMIFDTKVPNPSLKIWAGGAPQKNEVGLYEITFLTNQLSIGIYELKLVRLSTISDILNFVAGKNFIRTFFEIITTEKEATSIQEIKKSINNFEESYNSIFYSGIDISVNDNKNAYCLFVLIKGVLLGNPCKFDKFEIISLNQSLESKDEINFINLFLKEHTKANLQFEYDQDAALKSHILNPVSVVHFPKIISESIETAVNFAANKVRILLQSFTLTRNASGEVFSIISIDMKNGKGSRHEPRKTYIGNLATGDIAGERAETLVEYFNSLDKDPFKSFLVSLHKEALNEKNIHFKFFRYWNILETLAESKNYNSNDKLLDYEGKIMYQKENGEIKLDKKKIPIPEKINKSRNIVFNLIKEHGIGNTEETLDKVNMWFSLRNAVAHFGSIQNWYKLDRGKEHAKKAIEIMEQTNSYDSILSPLKNDVVRILERELLFS
ncbi:MAG: hypothetical protein IPK31_01900 [Chitinophagaceae bacterium]|nr:hypothetical protein [Chitinophagaceae bacterium]